MIGEQNSDQSLHLKMETDNHNHRYKSYRGTRCSVTMATLGGGGVGIIISSLRLAVGAMVQWFSSVGCSALWLARIMVHSTLIWWTNGKGCIIDTLKPNHMKHEKNNSWFSCVKAMSDFAIKEASFVCASLCECAHVCVWITYGHMFLTI